MAKVWGPLLNAFASLRLLFDAYDPCYLARPVVGLSVWPFLLPVAAATFRVFPAVVHSDVVLPAVQLNSVAAFVPHVAKWRALTCLVRQLPWSLRVPWHRQHFVG